MDSKNINNVEPRAKKPYVAPTMVAVPVDKQICLSLKSIVVHDVTGAVITFSADGPSFSANTADYLDASTSVFDKSSFERVIMRSFIAAYDDYMDGIDAWIQANNGNKEYQDYLTNLGNAGWTTKNAAVDPTSGVFGAGDAWGSESSPFGN